MSPQDKRKNRQATNPLPLTDVRAARIIYAIDSDLPDEDVNQLCQAALKIDPDSVDAFLLLGMRANNRQDRLQYFQRCSHAAKRKPKRLVEQLMPLHRQHMASLLIQDAQLADAVELLLPGLAEDPEDVHDSHFLIIDAMLRLGWDDELAPVVARFADRSPVASFAAAILAYRAEGPSDHALKLLEQADDQYPGVAGRLCDSRPWSDPYQMDNMDEIEASIEMIAKVLLPGVRDTAGAIKWIRDSLADSIERFNQWQEEGSQSVDESDLDDLEAASNTPIEDDVWDMVVKENCEPESGMSLVILINQSQAVGLELITEEVTPPKLWRCLLKAINDPLEGEPARPSTLRVGSAALKRDLVELCNQLDIQLLVKRPSKILQKLVEHLVGSLKAGSKADREQERPLELSAVDELDQTDETWLLGTFTPPLYVHDSSTPRRGWITLVAAASGNVLQLLIQDQRPTEEALAQTIVQAMLHPQVGPSRKPQEVLVAPDCWTDQLRDYEGLTMQPGEWGVTEFFQGMLAEMLEFQGPVKPSLRKQPGVTDELLENFYRTAARFYRATPWRMVGGDRIIEAYYEGWPNPRCAACIMGQMGQERGLSIFDKPQDALQLIASSGRSMTSLNSAVIHFSEGHEVIPVDLWNIECMGWEVAGPEAAPFVARVVNGKQLVAATADDLRTLAALLQHTLLFLDHPSDQPYQVQHEGLPLHLRWLN